MKIVFPDKEQGANAYITANDVNEIKSVVNTNADDLVSKIASEVLNRNNAIAASVTNFNQAIGNLPTTLSSLTEKSYNSLTDKPTSLPASDVFTWAKNATKPIYYFSELQSKPTTLSGYGITDTPWTSYLPLSGGTVTGALTVNAKTTVKGLAITNGTQTVNLVVDSNGVLMVDNSIYSTAEISAYGAGVGGTGGGLITQVFGYSNIGQAFTDSDLTNTFNAFTIKQINNRLTTVENANYLSGLNSTLVINALGFTPYNSSNPAGYITASSLPTKVSQLTNDSGFSTVSYVNQKVADLVNGAPASLDALNELASALGNDPNFATTVTNLIGTKQVQLNGLGFIKINGTTVSYDNSTYLTTGVASSTYLPLSGGTITGALSVNNNTTLKGLTLTNGSKSVNLIVDVDGNLSVDKGLYSSDFLSAYGVGSSGGSGGGLIQTVYNLSNLGGAFLNTNLTDTFNAFTINAINNRLKITESTINTLQPLSSAINAGNIGSQAVSSATTAGYLTGRKAYTNGTDGWWRSDDNAGWYSATYSVGIYAVQSNEVRTYAGANFLSEGNLSGADVISRGNVGFHNDGYSVNVPNPIWSFGNSHAYGMAYYQGTSGVNGSDTIGFHFGNINVPNFQVGTGGQVYAKTIHAQVTSLSENKTIGTNANTGLNILSQNGLYGLYTGVGSSGGVWMQVGRQDSAIDMYDLRLQPNGGNVVIGYSSDQGYKLAVNGSGYFASTVTAQGQLISNSSLNLVGAPYTNVPIIIGNWSGAGAWGIGNDSAAGGHTIRIDQTSGQSFLGATDVQLKLGINTVYHSGNSNLSIVDWSARSLVTSGNNIFRGKSSNLLCITPSDDVDGIVLYGTNAANTIANWAVYKNGDISARQITANVNIVSKGDVIAYSI